MTLPDIRYTFSLPELPHNAYWLRLIASACPHTIYDAREKYIEYYDWLGIKHPIDLSKEAVCEFLLSRYSYDAIDVGAIINGAQRIWRETSNKLS